MILMLRFRTVEVPTGRCVPRTDGREVTVPVHGRDRQPRYTAAIHSRDTRLYDPRPETAPAAPPRETRRYSSLSM